MSKKDKNEDNTKNLRNIGDTIVSSKNFNGWNSPRDPDLGEIVYKGKSSCFFKKK